MSQPSLCPLSLQKFTVASMGRCKQYLERSRDGRNRKSKLGSAGSLALGQGLLVHCELDGVRCRTRPQVVHARLEASLNSRQSSLENILVDIRDWRAHKLQASRCQSQKIKILTIIVETVTTLEARLQFCKASRYAKSTMLVFREAAKNALKTRSPSAMPDIIVVLVKEGGADGQH